MLQNSFCHISGVGLKTERRLWAAGVRCWDDACSSRLPMLGANLARRVRQGCEESRRRLAAGDAAWFGERLPGKEIWRLFPEFRGSVAYLDIETTGLSPDYDHITTIVLCDGERVHHWVHGQGMDGFAEQVARHAVLVSYNGKTFDVPFLRQALGVPLPHAHIDLRYVLAGMGYGGGLKACERALGLDRGDLADVDGFFAVLLWQEYQRRRDRRVLETLLAYNTADVLNLAIIMPRVYNGKLRDTPFLRSHQLPAAVLPDNPFRAHLPTIQRLMGGRWY